MAGSFRAFKYGTELYGNFGPQITQSYIFAQALDYSTVRIMLDVPEKIGFKYALVRSIHGTAEDPSDGVTISSGVVSTLQIEVEDTIGDYNVSVSLPTDYSPISGTTYYTLFGFDENGAWYKDAATSVVVPTNKQTTKKVIDLLPTMFTSEDSNPFSPTNYESDLQKFLYGFGLTYDELSSMIDFVLPENRSRYTTRMLSGIFATGIGMPNEYLIGVAANARLYRESGYIYRNKGTASGIATYVEALTGWQTVVRETNNKFLSLDDGSFEYGTGNWSFDSNDSSLESVAIDGVNVVGPPIEYETEDYAFSRLGVGQVTLNASSSRLSLPGSSNRLLCIPVVGGRSHYLAVPCRQESGSGMILQPSIEWLDIDGSSISTSVLSNAEVTSEWSVAGGPVIAPDNAAFAMLHLDLVGVAGDVAQIDMLSFSEEVATFRTNLMENPSAEDGTAGFELTSPTGTVLTASTEQAWVGEQSLKITSADATARTVGVRNDVDYPVAEATTVTGSAYVYSTTPVEVSLSFDWKSGGSYLSTSTRDGLQVPANAWTRVSYTVTSPASTTGFQFAIDSSTAIASTDAVYVDGVMVEERDRLGDFIAGSTGTLYGASGKYGDFIYSTYDVGYVYRDPRSITVICQPDRVNLIHDPAFDADVSDWTAESGVLTKSSDKSLSGSSSGKAEGESWSIESNTIPAVGSYSYSVSVWVSGSGSSVQAEIDWYDYSDALLRVDQLDVPSLSDDWVEITGTVSSPDRTSYGVLRLSGSGTVYVDNVLLERSDRPLTFFSGTLSDVYNQDGLWSRGTENSYSLLYNKLPVKLGRIKQTLPYYLPVGVTARVVLWDSLDPEVQALVPRGIY